MWIFTKDGFFSVVQKPGQKGSDMVTIRSRDKKDLLNLVKVIGQHVIVDGGGTDYEFRLICHKRAFKTYLANQVNEIDYDNFKHEVQIKDKKRASIYLEIWGAMTRVAKSIKRATYYRPPYGGYFDAGGIWRDGRL